MAKTFQDAKHQLADDTTMACLDTPSRKPWNTPHVILGTLDEAEVAGATALDGPSAS